MRTCICALILHAAAYFKLSDLPPMLMSLSLIEDVKPTLIRGLLVSETQLANIAKREIEYGLLHFFFCGAKDHWLQHPGGPLYH